jgi:adenylate kinase family enzyme
MRIAILGNSGSGKSTLAKWLVERSGAALLDLDSVAWEPGQVAVQRSEKAAEEDVRRFCAGTRDWVVEGCYANLVRVALKFEPHLMFLNPGEVRCVSNCRSRPWEPHKYSSKAEQDQRLAFLLSWVAEYYRRDGDMSLSAHAACFREYPGPKREYTETPGLNPPSAELLALSGPGRAEDVVA